MRIAVPVWIVVTVTAGACAIATASAFSLSFGVLFVLLANSAAAPAPWAGSLRAVFYASVGCLSVSELVLQGMLTAESTALSPSTYAVLGILNGHSSRGTAGLVLCAAGAVVPWLGLLTLGEPAPRLAPRFSTPMRGALSTAVVLLVFLVATLLPSAAALPLLCTGMAIVVLWARRPLPATLGATPAEFTPLLEVRVIGDTLCA